MRPLLKKMYPLVWVFFCTFLYLVLCSHGTAGHVVKLEKVPGDVHIIGPGEDELGWSMASGDVNGDGTEDLIVGDPRLKGPSGQAGGCYVFFGRKLTSPSTLIELSTEAADITIYGLTSSGHCGDTAASGDINGDGIDDIALGEWLGNNPVQVTSRVIVVYGRTDFAPPVYLDLKATPPDLVVNEDVTGTYEITTHLGRGLGLGDFNGDGIDDLYMGAPALAKAGSGIESGGAFLVYGSASFPPHHVIDLGVDRPGLTILGKVDLDFMGRYLAGGDLNGDGFDEFIVAAPYASVNKVAQGAVYVVFGEPNLPDGTVLDLSKVGVPVTILGEKGGDNLSRLACGEVNGDGFEDLICASPFHDDLGRVYVIRGMLSFPPNYVKWLSSDPADLTIQGEHGYLGYSVASQDASGDGLDDVITGDRYGGQPGYLNGATFVVFGAESLGSPAFIDLAVESGDIKIIGKPVSFMGTSVCGCDFNGDGFSDVIPGSPQGGPGPVYPNGAAYVILSGGALPYGQGLAGSGGIIPELSNTADELPVISTGQLELTISNGLGGTYGLLFFGLAPGEYPFNGGSFLLDATGLFMALPVTLTNPGGGSGTGTYTLPLIIPDIPELNILPIYLQAALNDPGAVKGTSLTKGLQISFLSKGE